MWALVPVKALTASKARLAPVLSARERAELVLVMLADLLTVLEDVAEIARILVLTGDPVVAARVRDRQHGVVPELANLDVNANLNVAADACAGAVARLLVIPADLAALTPLDIEALLEAHEGGVTLAPAAIDGGTNAVVVEPANALPFEFGEQSLKKHRAAARLRSLPCRLVERVNLSRDLDRPDDLLWFLEASGASRTWTYLSGLDVPARLARGSFRNTA